MADGTTTPISDIDLGDKVLATDPDTGETTSQTATTLWIHDDTVINLELDNGATITTTDHPFWNHTDQQWQPAEALDTGDQLHTTTSENITVVGINPATAHTQTAYNLTVHSIHTYYVLAGNTPVLVHNDKCETALFGNGGLRPPRARSYRGTDAGTFETRDEAWAAANRDRADYTYASPREECSPTGCHVHLDVYNNQGRLLETRHYTYHQR